LCVPPSVDISLPHEFEEALGGTHDLFFTEIKYEERYQRGFDFVVDTVGAIRDARGRGVTFSTLINLSTRRRHDLGSAEQSAPLS
jgi:hypothetical protein